MKAIKFQHDPGHGWLEVSVELLPTVGLTKDDFTGYSYESRDGKTVYLEEDCDAYTFMQAWVKHFGKQPEVESFGDAEWVRALPRLDTNFGRDADSIAF